MTRAPFVSRRLRRALLVAAVAPAPLGPALENLVDAGLIGGYEQRKEEVLVWGDLGRMECAIDALGQQTQAPVDHPDGRDDYYRAFRDYTLSASFRALPPANRAIVRLHAAGISHARICAQLSISPMKVRYAVKGARLAMKLPAAVNTLPRGGGKGRPRKAWKCSQPDCSVLPRRNGLCERHCSAARRESRRRTAESRKT